MPVVRMYGLPDQTLTDKGTEIVVLAFVCHHLNIMAGRFGVLPRQAHRFIPSTRNVSRRPSVLHTSHCHYFRPALPTPISLSSTPHHCRDSGASREVQR